MGDFAQSSTTNKHRVPLPLETANTLKTEITGETDPYQTCEL
jgi:hypothetical protein